MPGGVDLQIGLSTYAFLWRSSSRMPEPIDLAGMIREAAQLGVAVLQVCDYSPVTNLSVAGAARLAALAREANISLELGTRGIDDQTMSRYLELGHSFDSRLIRSMITRDEVRLGAAEIIGRLRNLIPKLESASTTLALETYEQIDTNILMSIVEEVDHPLVGICLDPANTIAALESPNAVIDRCAARVVNLHIKDFVFARSDQQIGFELTGCPLGSGQLDLTHLLEAVRPSARGITAIVEHWLPWQGSADATASAELEWTQHAVDCLRVADNQPTSQPVDQFNVD